MASFDRTAGLVLFARIVQAGSMTAAALALGIGRSSVSKQLAALERHIGSRLLQRTTRQLSLTEVGEQVFIEAMRVQDAVEAVEAISDSHRSIATGKLKVSCSTALGRMHLVPLLAEFQREFPSIELSLYLEDRSVDLVEEQVDVAIRIGHLPDSTLVARRLGELKWIACATPTYIAQAGAPQTPSDLRQHRCVYYRNQKTLMNSWSFIGPEGEQTVTLQGGLTINDASALVEAALTHMGILLIDKGMLGDALESGKLVPVLQDYPLAPGFPVYAVYPAKNYLPAKTAAFVEFVMRKMAPLI